MPRIPRQAVENALHNIWDQELSPLQAAFLECFLVAKWLARKDADCVAGGGQSTRPTIALTNAAVHELFTDFPDCLSGRLYPFRPSTNEGTDCRPKWQMANDSGRKTIWNTSTRTRQRVMFNTGGLAAGLKDDAAEILAQNMQDKRLNPVDVAVVMLRNQEVDDISATSLVDTFKARFGLDDTDIAAFTTALTRNWQSTSIAPGPSWEPVELPDEWKPGISARAPSEQMSGTANSQDVHSLEDEFEVVLEPRVMRMLRASIAAHHGVIAIGPPGSGKTTLIEQVIRQARTTPESFGFQATPCEPIVATPDESWTTRELVGGDTVVGGALRFVGGYIIQAIAANRWLFLDEINRADMDRIFGGLFTWLSGKSVEVGRESPDATARPIVLGWSGQPNCVVENSASDPQIKYLAGDEWRLLGTYNAVDAAKVFRFGQALGRRFVRVPVPAAEPRQIRRVFASSCAALPDRAVDDIMMLYDAHYSIEPLGPAIFLRIPYYLRAAGIDQESEPSSYLDCLAEGYVVNAGGWIAKLDEVQRRRLSELLSGQDRIFDDQNWGWIEKMIQNVG